MSGIVRIFLVVCCALFRFRSVAPAAGVRSVFHVTPWDTGLAKLKSDKYFQLAEAAQFDFVIRTGLIGTMLRNGYHFINTSQLVTFSTPVKLFARVAITTRIVYWDTKCAYFEHVFAADGSPCACVLVRMKFKKGGRTIDPTDLIGPCSIVQPESLQYWDRSIEALRQAGLRERERQTTSGGTSAGGE